MSRTLMVKFGRFGRYLRGVINHLITLGIVLFLLATYFIPEVFAWLVIMLIFICLLIVQF